MTKEQRASEAAIRALIESWATAVQARDLDGVLADHADDIQMFDVPPPNELRGIEAYRESWPEEGLSKDPDTRLRLTIGLRKEGGRWVVSHEHHSFPARD